MARSCRSTPASRRRPRAGRAPARPRRAARPGRRRQPHRPRCSATTGSARRPRRRSPHCRGAPRRCRSAPRRRARRPRRARRRRGSHRSPRSSRTSVTTSTMSCVSARSGAENQTKVMQVASTRRAGQAQRGKTMILGLGSGVQPRRPRQPAISTRKRARSASPVYRLPGIRRSIAESMRTRMLRRSAAAPGPEGAPWTTIASPALPGHRISADKIRRGACHRSG